MELHFEVRFRHDRKLLREIFRARRRWGQGLICLFAVLLGVQIVWDAAAGRGISATGCALFVSFAAIGCLTAPGYTARVTEQRYRNRFGGELPEVAVLFSDEDIRLNMQKDEQHFDYAQVERIVRRSGMWILTVVGQLSIPVPDAGYVQGTPAAFAEFIRSKCPQAKIKG